MTQEKSLEENENKSQNWDAKKLTELLGYEYSPEHDESDTDESNGNVPKLSPIQEELLELEEARTNKTKHTFSNNPFSKFGSVGLIMGMIFLVIALIIHAVTSDSPKVASSKKPKQPSAENSIKVTENKDEQEKGDLKANIALGEQVRNIKKIENEKLSHQFKVSKIKKNPVKTEVEPLIEPKVEQRPIQPRNKIPPPPPIYKPRPQRIAKIPNLPVEKPTPPIERWKELNRLGAYGGDWQPQQPKSTIEEVSNVEEQNKIPQAKKVLIASQNTGASCTPQTASNESVLPEEAKILGYGDNNTKYLIVGNTIPAKLLTPLFWSQPQNNDKKFVAVLTQPFTVNNEIVLPKNTEVIFSVENVQNSGLVQGNVTQMILNNQEYTVPPGTISMNGDQGKPLIASVWNHKRKKTFQHDAEIFAVGSLAKVGATLNQPRSERFSSSSSLGGSSFSSVRRGRKNILGAVLEGGFSPLTQQILERNQKALSKIGNIKDIWFIKPGSQIQLSVNQSFQIDSSQGCN